MNDTDDIDLEDLPRRPPPGMLRFTLKEIITGVTILVPMLFGVAAAYVHLTVKIAADQNKIEALEKKVDTLSSASQVDAVKKASDEGSLQLRLQEIENNELNNTRNLTRRIDELEEDIEDIKKRRR